MKMMKKSSLAVMAGLMSLSMMVSPVSAKTNALKPYTGWKVKGKHKYYYENDMKQKGFTQIGKLFYYFDKKTGAMKTGTLKVKGVTYYLNKKGVMELRKANGYYYNKNNLRVDYWDGYEYETIQRAKKIISQITTKKMSKSQKLLKCFKWVQAFHYKTPRKLSFKKGWVAVYANDHLEKKGDGDCHSDACAFAYLAYALGYKKVYVASDSTNVKLEVHSFTEINGRVYDPLFATSYGMKTNYNASYKAYRDGKARAQKIPYATYKPIGKKKTIKAKVVKTVTGWNATTKHLILSNGEYATGIHYYKKKFYAFDDKGKYDAAKTKALRKADVYNTPISTLSALLGTPLSTQYVPTCLSDGGTDGLWKYANFTIATHKTTDGQEYYQGVNSN